MHSKSSTGNLTEHPPGHEICTAPALQHGGTQPTQTLLPRLNDLSNQLKGIKMLCKPS